jgi:hypothetical protein
MAELRQRIQTALNENRILVLGTQVLLGFQLRAIFEPKFEHLPASHRELMLGVLVLLLSVLGLLLLPTSYHRIVDRGEDRPRFYLLIGQLMRYVLPLLIAAIALQIFVAAGFIVPVPGAIAIGGALAFGAWLYLGLLESRGRHTERHMPPPQQTDLSKRVDHVLTEARVILPGAQALLGFQLVTVFMDAFDHLPASSRLIHLVSLCLIALTTLILLAPAARHRIVEKGEDTEPFQHYAGRALIIALIPLGLGCVGDLFVVTRKITGSLELALGLAAAMSLFLFGLWFGFTFWRRARNESRRWSPSRA